MNSLLQDTKVCYVCGKTPVQKHHIMKGIRNRNKAEEDGLFVYLCLEHHLGTFGVHGTRGHKLDLDLIKQGELYWLKHFNKTVDDFIARYGRNYLD